MIGTGLAELHLTLAPQRRFEAIDVTSRIPADARQIVQQHRRTLYCSLHTTAGYLEQSLSNRIGNDHQGVAQFFGSFHALFPPNAEYKHDKMELRTELTDAQKKIEPKNADSHLTFMGAGVRNCVTYTTQPGSPVYFIELDGKSEAMQRRRRTTIVAYDEEREVAHASVTIPMSKHPIDSVNLADPRFGIIDQC
ncbi:MAG TPA: hypothetical protein VFA27_15645, partial [Vicinamibacterales bacterium]|nr:hypothetical protein [Vicinamibacterales bacterium]